MPPNTLAAPSHLPKPLDPEILPPRKPHVVHIQLHSFGALAGSPGVLTCSRAPTKPGRFLKQDVSFSVWPKLWDLQRYCRNHVSIYSCYHLYSFVVVTIFSKQHTVLWYICPQHDLELVDTGNVWKNRGLHGSPTDLSQSARCWQMLANGYLNVDISWRCEQHINHEN